MTATVVIGSQWGDEGKGKIIDFLGQNADVTVRYSGGDNAGHSLVVNDQKLALRLIPSGILAPNSICIIGNGTVVNPHTLLDEIKELNQAGVNTDHTSFSLTTSCKINNKNVIALKTAKKLVLPIRALVRHTWIRCNESGSGPSTCLTLKD